MLLTDITLEGDLSLTTERETQAASILSGCHTICIMNCHFSPLPVPSNGFKAGGTQMVKEESTSGQSVF